MVESTIPTALFFTLPFRLIRLHIHIPFTYPFYIHQFHSPRPTTTDIAMENRPAPDPLAALVLQVRNAAARQRSRPVRERSLHLVARSDDGVLSLSRKELSRLEERRQDDARRCAAERAKRHADKRVLDRHRAQERARERSLERKRQECPAERAAQKIGREQDRKSAEKRAEELAKLCRTNGRSWRVSDWAVEMMKVYRLTDNASDREKLLQKTVYSPVCDK